MASARSILRERNMCVSERECRTFFTTNMFILHRALRNVRAARRSRRLNMY